jgi:hypothetical protein
MSLISNKPVLYHVQTHEIPFRRHIPRGISCSDVN